MKAMIIETRRAVCAGPRSLLVPLPRPRPFGLEVRSRHGLYQARPDHAAQRATQHRLSYDRTARAAPSRDKGQIFQRLCAGCSDVSSKLSKACLLHKAEFRSWCFQWPMADLLARAMTSSGVGGFGGWKERQIGALSLNGLPLFSVLK
jgi:hypothetical protein